MVEEYVSDFGKLTYTVSKDLKVVFIFSFDCKDSQDNFNPLIEAFVKQYVGYSITFTLISEKDNYFGLLCSLLENLNFKHLFSKLVFSKKIEKQNFDFKLSFKICSEENKLLIKNMYLDEFKTCKFASGFEDFAFSDFVFEEYIWNSKEPNWNILVYDDENLVGFMCLAKYSYNGDYGSANFIYTKPEFRGNGLNKQMMVYAQNLFVDKEIFEWRGSTDSKNISMIRSFKKEGFKQTNEQFGFVLNPEIAYSDFM